MLASCEGEEEDESSSDWSGDSHGDTEVSLSNLRSPSSPTDYSIIRLRFFNFNMANMAALDPSIGLFEDFLQRPFAGGGSVDVAFAALTEARFKMRFFVESQLQSWQNSRPDSGLDHLVARDALRAEGARRRSSSWFEWCRKKVVQHYVGNVKTVLGFSRQRFDREIREEELTGHFTLNPEKAFLGTSIVQKMDGLRLAFFGTHFPMQKLQHVLMKTKHSAERICLAKLAYAEILREVLVQASAWDLTNDQTVIFVQGDLNSRTVFDHDFDGSEEGSKAKDVLLEVLNDPILMAALSRDIPFLPMGQWHEVVRFRSVSEMPVTYKVDPKMAISQSVTVGDILERVHDPALPPPSSKHPERQLSSVDSDEYGGRWGLKKDPATVKASHFPAFTERVIYWAPNSLARHIRWSFPNGGYDIIGQVDGSDHRPVILEASLEICSGEVSPDLNPLPPPDDPDVKDMAEKLRKRQPWRDKLFCYSEDSSDSEPQAW